MKQEGSQLTNILAIALDNDDFRKNLIERPDLTLRKAKINATKEDLDALKRILEEADYDVERAGCQYNMECGYRGY